MNRDDFERRLLLYGGRLDRWPPAEAAAARALADRDEAARALLDEAQALDALTAQAVAAEPAGGALTGQVLARVHGRTSRLGAARGRLWRLACAAVPLAAAAGFAAGFFVGPLAPPLDEAMLLVMAGGEPSMWLLP